MSEFSENFGIETGSTLGNGCASAMFYAQEGVKVVVCGNNDTDSPKTACLIQEENSEAAFFVETDLVNPVDCENLVRRTVKKYGPDDFAWIYMDISRSRKMMFDNAAH